MALKRSNVFITVIFFISLGLFLAVGDGNWDYVPSLTVLLVLCGAVGFASARLGDPGSYDKYSTFTSLTGLVVGGVWGWIADSWAAYTLAQGRAVQWPIALPLLFGFTAAAGYFFGSLTPGLRPMNPARTGRFRRVVLSEDMRTTDVYIEYYMSGSQTVPGDDELLEEFRNPRFVVTRANPDDRAPLYALRPGYEGFVLTWAHFSCVDRSKGLYSDPVLKHEWVDLNQRLSAGLQFLVRR